MIGIVFAVLGATALGAAMGSSSAKTKLLTKPTYLAVLTFKDGTVGSITGTLLTAWGNAMTAVSETKSSANPITSVVLKAPDGTTIRRWPN